MKQVDVLGRIGLRDIIERMINAGDLRSSLKELIINGLDACPVEALLGTTPLVDIRIKRGEFIRVADSGVGFTERDVQGYFNFSESWKREHATTTGKNGTGRTFVFSYANALSPWSRSQAYPQFMHLEFTKDALLKCDEQRGIRGVYQHGLKPPDWWDLPGFGTIVDVLGIDWSLVPPDEEIPEALTYSLGSFVAPLVTINGEPLPPRKMAKDPLLREAFREELGGRCRYRLFIRSSRDECSEIMIGGAVLPIMGLIAFVKGMGQQWFERLPSIFKEGIIVGDVCIPILNQYRQDDSASLERTVYKSVAFDIFGLLVGEIADEAQKYFEEHRAEEEKDRDARFLRDFTDRVNAVQGVQDQDLPDDLPLGTGSKDKQKRGKRTKRAPFSVSPGNTKILRGTSITFRVYGYTGTSGKFQCQIDNGQCGDVQQLDDLTFEYAGDKAGSDTLVFSDAKDPKKEVRRVVEVVTRRGLAINPLEITIPQGGQQRFSVANHHLLKPEHNVRWSMDDQKGLRLLRRCRRNSQTCTVYASSSCPLGTYVLVGQVPDTRMKATATFTVIEGDDREVPLRLEDRWYRLRAGDLQETLVHLSQDFRLDTTPGSKRFLTEIKIKLDHPVIHQLERLPPSRSEQAHDQYRNLVILDAIIAAHLAQEGADGMSFVQRMSELQRIVIPAFSAK